MCQLSSSLLNYPSPTRISPLSLPSPFASGKMSDPGSSDPEFGLCSDTVLQLMIFFFSVKRHSSTWPSPKKVRGPLN